MTLLLDTHTLLWALLEPHKLSARVQALIEDRANAALVSSASVWEIITKHRLGKLPLATDVAPDIEGHLTRFGARELPINHAHARLAASFAHPHKDPFDRILAAQAIVEGVAFITQDGFFRDVGVMTLW